MFGAEAFEPFVNHQRIVGVDRFGHVRSLQSFNERLLPHTQLPAVRVDNVWKRQAIGVMAANKESVGADAFDSDVGALVPSHY